MSIYLAIERLTEALIEDELYLACSDARDVIEDVRETVRMPSIAAVLETMEPAALSSHLRQYGAWDAAELADHEANLERLVWIVSCDIREERARE